MLAYMKHAFDLFLSVYGIWILLALGITLFLKYLTGRQAEIAFVESCLGKVDGFLQDKFGDKSTVIVDAIRRGLEDIKDGEYTDQEMLEEFIRIVKARAFESDNKPLTDDENKAVEEAAQMTVSSFSDKKKRNIAFQLLSKN